MSDSQTRIVIPIDVIGDDEIPSPVEAGRAAAQRADWHIDMPDQDLMALALAARSACLMQDGEVSR